MASPKVRENPAPDRESMTSHPTCTFALAAVGRSHLPDPHERPLRENVPRQQREGGREVEGGQEEVCSRLRTVYLIITFANAHFFQELADGGGLGGRAVPRRGEEAAVGADAEEEVRGTPGAAAVAEGTAGEAALHAALHQRLAC